MLLQGGSPVDYYLLDTGLLQADRLFGTGLPLGIELPLAVAAPAVEVLAAAVPAAVPPAVGMAEAVLAAFRPSQPQTGPDSNTTQTKD